MKLTKTLMFPTATFVMFSKTPKGNDTALAGIFPTGDNHFLPHF